MDAALVWTIALGALSGTLLIGCRIRSRTALRPAELVIAFLAAGGIAVGVQVCSLSLDHSLRGLDGQRIYLLLAGLCMVWMSALTILDVYRRALRNRHAAAASGRALREKPEAPE